MTGRPSVLSRNPFTPRACPIRYCFLNMIIGCQYFGQSVERALPQLGLASRRRSAHSASLWSAFRAIEFSKFSAPYTQVSGCRCSHLQLLHQSVEPPVGRLLTLFHAECPSWGGKERVEALFPKQLGFYTLCLAWTMAASVRDICLTTRYTTSFIPRFSWPHLQVLYLSACPHLGFRLKPVRRSPCAAAFLPKSPCPSTVRGTDAACVCTWATTVHTWWRHALPNW